MVVAHSPLRSYSGRVFTAADNALVLWLLVEHRGLLRTPACIARVCHQVAPSEGWTPESVTLILEHGKRRGYLSLLYCEGSIAEVIVTDFAAAARELDRDMSSPDRVLS